ncbi:MAG: type IV pili twitching motility protein PilT, partial [Planctomycetota bacterium]
MDVFALMDEAHGRGASDLHLSVGRPPVMRLSGSLVEVGDAPLTPQDTEAMAKSVTPPRNWDELQKVGTTDFGSAHRDKCRFRISVLTQKGTRG